ncbi:MAG: hypothetical protein LBJ63_06950 [Prevotellaceae bacterium]|jgi:hypothetical protein|nr:hypothetical protein [Prevotellaceae bacterium]
MIFTGRKLVNPAELWEKYLRRKQTYQELAQAYGCSSKTIRRRLDKYSVELNEHFPKVANVVMDTTYFGRSLGVMCFKDSITKTLLHKQYVRYETNVLYFGGIEIIHSKGVVIKSIICDGRKGLFHLFGDIPIQMCRRHQIEIVRRYLTRNPKLQAGKELYILVKNMALLIKYSF